MNIYKYIVLFLMLFASANSYASQNMVEKSFCLSAIGSQKVDILKKNLLVNVKREAVSEIFGELITAFTKIDKGLLTEDQLKLASAGYIRIKGNPKFSNGSNFAEVCVSVNAYANDDDKEKYKPIQVENKECASNPKLTTRKIKDYAKQQSIIQALIKYNRNLEGHSDETLLKLLHEVKYIESGFIPDTETYCAKVKGVLYPIEVVATLNSGKSQKISTFFNSCNEIYVDDRSKKSGIYKIDVDGVQGKIEPFNVYCDMSNEGGGWTLFAHHRDGLAKVNAIEFVTSNSYGVMGSNRWALLRDNMKTGMMFVDEHGRVSTISASKLKDSRCTPVSNTSNLSAPAHNDTSIWHTENSGCNGRGGDYSLIVLAGEKYKYNGIAGASVYQMSSTKFDKWPYNKEYSYKNQNKLLYYIK